MLIVSLGLLLAACAEDDDTAVYSTPTTVSTTSTTVERSTAGTAAERARLRELANYFSHAATDAELDAGFVVTVPGSAYDDLVAVRTNLGGVPEATAAARRAGDLTISVLRASTGDFRAPRCPPSVNEDGCPTVRGDTVVQIRFASGELIRGVWTWSETGAILEALRDAVPSD